MLKENSKIVYDFVKAHDGEDFTAQDIADATGLSVRSVNGIVTSAFQRHKDKDKNEVPLMVRVPAEIQDPETGLHKAIKFIQLTDAGREFAEPSFFAYWRNYDIINIRFHLSNMQFNSFLQSKSN